MRPGTRAAMAIFILAAALAHGGQPGEPGPWIDLFNGKDLTGWQANKFPESFSVTADGLLRAQGVSGLSHLLYVGQGGDDAVFKDFELTATVRGEPNANSGIFFHTSLEMRKNKFLLKGYEVQLNSSEKEKRKTGGLYAIADLWESPVDETQWFDITVRVEGKRVNIAIDGEPVLEYVEPDEPYRTRTRAGRVISPSGGLIAIQAHDPGSVFYFKSLKIRRLDAEPKAP